MNNPQTFVQKALARAAGLPHADVDAVVDARPDRILSHDNTAAIARIFAEFGLAALPDPHRLAITLDHAAPPPTARHAQNHADVRAFVAQHGVTHFFEVGRGICHQVLSEEALVLPGQAVLGADSHTTHFGWMGAFGAGVGRSEVAALWATGELWLRVPPTIRITLEGKLPDCVTAKDLCLYIIGQFGADGGLYAALAFDGPGLATLTLEQRMVIPNMMAEFGVKSASLLPDDAVFDWLAPRLAQRQGISTTVARAIVTENALYPDTGASYVRHIDIDLSTLEPLVACPHQVDNVQPLSAVTGVTINQAFVGTCTNGRLEDIAAASAVVRGNRVAPGVRLLVIPASSQVLLAATRLGYIEALVDAGAVIGPPGCGPCMGNHLGVPATGEVTISTGNRNFRGRMGQPDADVYLASPAVVAAAALAGRITDPRVLP